MTSSANFSKTTKLLEPVGQVQFVVFEKFTSAYFTKLHRKTCCNVNKKTSQRFKKDVNFSILLAICNLYSCYNVALVLHEISLVFSQSDACNFSFTLLALLLTLEPASLVFHVREIWKVKSLVWGKFLFFKQGRISTARRKSKSKRSHFWTTT